MGTVACRDVSALSLPSWAGRAAPKQQRRKAQAGKAGEAAARPPVRQLAAERRGLTASLPLRARAAHACIPSTPGTSTSSRRTRSTTKRPTSGRSGARAASRCNTSGFSGPCGEMCLSRCDDENTVCERFGHNRGCVCVVAPRATGATGRRRSRARPSRPISEMREDGYKGPPTDTRRQPGAMKKELEFFFPNPARACKTCWVVGRLAVRDLVSPHGAQAATEQTAATEAVLPVASAPAAVQRRASRCRPARIALAESGRLTASNTLASFSLSLVRMQTPNNWPTNCRSML